MRAALAMPGPPPAGATPTGLDQPGTLVTAPHPPERPGWTCQTCAEPWPCPTRRQELARVDRTTAAIYLATQFSEAVKDLPNEPVAVLFNRIMAPIKAPYG
ncbi:hypothetical protein GCM10027605_06990 [Micromonospora zhanjiangensis]